jgi:lipoprotein Spr
MFPLKKALPLLLLAPALSCKPTRQVATYSGEILSRKTSVAPPADLLSNEKLVKEPGESFVLRPVYDTIQLKYASYLRVQPEQLKDVALYHFIERWLHTPYKWGGIDERGIDCSAFLQRLYADVYLIQIPRTSIQQFFAEKVELFKSEKYLSEGDLVFFRTMNNKFISHVGLYLHNDMFVNSSSSKGVSIASLKDPYWKKRYVAAGRLKFSRP